MNYTSFLSATVAFSLSSCLALLQIRSNMSSSASLSLGSEIVPSFIMEWPGCFWKSLVEVSPYSRT